MVTDTICLNGTRHRWKQVSIEFEIEVRKTSWCSICGSYTEFLRDYGVSRWRRCKDENGVLYIESPRVSSLWPWEKL